MEEITFKTYFHNAVLECTAFKIGETEQTEKWKVTSDKRTYIFQNDWPLLKNQHSKKSPHWRMIQGEILNVDHAKEECEEISLALERAIRRSAEIPNIRYQP